MICINENRHFFSKRLTHSSRVVSDSTRGRASLTLMSATRTDRRSVHGTLRLITVMIVHHMRFIPVMACGSSKSKGFAGGGGGGTSTLRPIMHRLHANYSRCCRKQSRDEADVHKVLQILYNSYVL